MRSSVFIWLILLLNVAGAASAETAHWQVQRFTQSFDQKGNAAGDFVYSGVKVWSVSPDSPEIRFGCSEKFGLPATLTFLPLSQVDPAKNERIKLRQKTTSLTIEGRAPERVPWTWVKDTRTVQTRSGKHAAMIYNAVVKQLPFKVKEPNKKIVTITPAPVDESFVFFVKNCKVTSGA